MKLTEYQSIFLESICCIIVKSYIHDEKIKDDYVISQARLFMLTKNHTTASIREYLDTITYSLTVEETIAAFLNAFRIFLLTDEFLPF